MLDGEIFVNVGRIGRIRRFGRRGSLIDFRLGRRSEKWKEDIFWSIGIVLGSRYWDNTDGSLRRGR
jgi:hypothetical protein